MDWLSTDHLFSFATALASVVLTALLWKAHWGQLRTDYFFLIFFTLSTIYLQVAPSLTLLNDSIGAASFGHEYAVLQFLSLALFQLPMLLIATWEPTRRDPAKQDHDDDDPVGEIRAEGWGAEMVCCGCAIFAILYLNTVVQNDLFFNRLGSDIAATRMVGLSFTDHALYRSFQEMFLFMAGTPYFIYRSAATRRIRTLGFCALVMCLGSWGTTALLNSRWNVAIACCCALGWWLSLRPAKASDTRMWLRFAAFGLLAVYLMNVVVNVRTMGYEGSFRLEYLTPGITLLDDEQGSNRLNGIDLMARLMVPVSEEGPALGVAWTHILWDVRRLIDPAGFDDFRLSLQTNAKSYLMTHYLGWRVADYYSCMMTDLFGNFGVAGFPLGAVIVGLVFRSLRREADAPRSGTMFLVALFVLTHVILFEQEASVLLFGWVKKLPIFLLVLAARPLTITHLHPRPARVVEDHSSGRNGYVSLLGTGARPVV